MEILKNSLRNKILNEACLVMDFLFHEDEDEKNQSNTPWAAILEQGVYNLCLGLTN